MYFINTHLKTLIIDPNYRYIVFNLNFCSMRPPTSLKKEFLKKWIMGLQLCSSSKKEMSFLERKKAIKLSADVAMASARNATTRWSRALISNASKDDSNKGLAECILGPESESLKRASMSLVLCNKRNRSKKILRKSCSIRRARKSSSQMVMAISIAKRLVKKRTQVLKSLVPGGGSMSEFSLIEETLDYILSLRAQVDVMRHLANATELLNRKWAEDSELFLLPPFLYFFLQD